MSMTMAASIPTPNITLKDADGKTIQLYKAVIDKDAEGPGP